MFPYILKRLLYFVPTFFVISLITFMLSQMAPGDPVELKLKGGMQSANQQAQDKLQSEKAYLELSEKYGRDLPPFYFSVTTKAEPDSLYKIRRKADRENLERLIGMYGDWPMISDYYYKVRALELAVLGMPDDTVDATAFEKKKTIRNDCNVLYINYDDNEIENYLKQMQEQVASSIAVTGPDSTQTQYKPLAVLSNTMSAVKESYEKIKTGKDNSLNYIPAIHWYGTDNQYHRWLFGNVPWFSKNTDVTRSCKGFFRGDLGISYVDDRPVSSIIQDSLRWTLLLNLIITILIYLISVPSGVSLAIHNNTLYDRVYTLFLFICYSLPVVWIGTLMITFLTSDYYGNSLNIFPPYGLGKVGSEFPFWERFTDRSYHFILPVLTLTIGSFAYIARQMRGSMLSVIRQDYIRTAFAKGLAPKTVFWKHAFRNSLLPIITIFSSLLPAMISGSVIAEYMFNIPGMGRVSYDAVIQRDYPVLFTILLFSAALTMLGNLVADILYVMVDPRISFNKKV
jgi:peptide/nickel transport system permease protein